MKKWSILLLVLIMCVSLVACNETNSSISEPTKPSLDVEQELVNICCAYSKCSSVKGFTIGTNNKHETEDGWEVEAKGSYYPVDEYGNLEDLMIFDIKFTATWNDNSNYYHIKVNSKRIREKY